MATPDDRGSAETESIRHGGTNHGLDHGLPIDALPGSGAPHEFARLIKAIVGSLRPYEVGIDGPVPNWCNLGIALRVMIGINFVFFCVAGAIAMSWRQWLDDCVRAAAFVEPVLIGCLFFGCLLRRVTDRWPAALQIAIALAVPAILTFVFEKVAGPLLEISEGLIVRNAIVAATLSAAVLFWAHLRDQSYLPALAEARLDALQARIRPHFLFNSLNAVLGLIRSEPRRAEAALEDLADLFRVLMRAPRERVTLAEEIGLCRNYLSIESLRLGERLQVSWDIDEETLGAPVPSLLLQPLIENSVLHGIEPSTSGGLIEIVVIRRGQYAQITISNPYHGEASGHAGHRIGLENVRQRLELMHDIEARLSTGIEDGRFHVVMRVPLSLV